MAKRMDIFLGERDQIEVTVYEHGQVLLYNKFTDALIQSDVAQIARVAEFVRESHAHLAQEKERNPE